MWENEEEEGVSVGEEERMVYVWVNEGEEGVCVGERGRGGCMCMGE